MVDAIYKVGGKKREESEGKIEGKRFCDEKNKKEKKKIIEEEVK